MTPTSTPENSANIACSFDPTEVIPIWENDKWVWHFSVRLQEMNGFSVTLQEWWLTSYDAAGNQTGDPVDFSQYITNFFGTNQVPAFGELSANMSIFRQDHTDTPSSMKQSFSGLDENGNTVSCDCMVYFKSSTQHYSEQVELDTTFPLVISCQ